MTDAIIRLERLFAEILSEARTRPQFEARLAKVFASMDALSSVVAQRPQDVEEVPSSPRRHRRAAAVIDVLSIFENGEDQLRAQLGKLTLNQLRDIVAEHGMDSNKLALKWRSRTRVEDLIVTTVRERMAKGSVFRRRPTS